MKKMKQVKEHMKDINMERLSGGIRSLSPRFVVMIAAGYLNYAGKRAGGQQSGLMRRSRGYSGRGYSGGESGGC